MAVLTGGDFTPGRRDAIRAKGRIVVSSTRGQYYMRSKPNKQKRPRSPGAQAWTDWFKQVNCQLKDPPGPILAQAQKDTKGTGWFWRDELMRAASGKLIQATGETLITTPTVSVYRSAAESITQNVLKVLTPNNKNWDNENFWNASVNPTRLTVQAPGLYFVTANAVYSGKSGGWRALFLRYNGTTEIGNVGIWPSNTAPGQLGCQAIYYFHHLDYIELCGFTDTTALTLQMKDFSMVAITPEAIV